MVKFDLTICSVSFYSRDYLRFNSRLAKSLNHGLAPRWLVIENTPADSPEGITLESDGFEIINGIDSAGSRLAPASFHHALGLNKVLEYVDTRFVLLLDPDFYIIREDWISQVINYLNEKNLAFFGAPWHPKWYRKYRYFPCTHCLFIDLSQIRKKTLDFRPAYVKSNSTESVGAGVNIAPSKRIFRILARIAPAPLRCMAGFVYDLNSNIDGRKGIGGSRDTGYNVFQLYRRAKQVQFECIVPVYNPERDYPVNSLNGLSRIIDGFLPDHASYMPKRGDSYTKSGFLEHICADTVHLGWEEFVWQSKPFAFHLRSQRQNRDFSKALKTLERVIEVSIH
jgi:hypothetical protein